MWAESEQVTRRSTAALRTRQLTIAQPVHQQADRLVLREGAGALHREPAQLGVVALEIADDALAVALVEIGDHRMPLARATLSSSSPRKSRISRTRASIRCAKWPRPSCISDSKLSLTFPARIAASSFSSL